LLYYIYYYRLSIERLEAMVKLHTFYVTNAITEMSYVNANITEEEFHQLFNQSLIDEDEIDDDEIINEDLVEDNDEIPEHHNQLIMEKYFNINDQEFQRALEMDVRVVIEETTIDYDYGNRDFNIDALLDANID